MTLIDIVPPQVTAQSATDQVFKTLSDAIITLKLPPGTKVSEADVSKQLDVSRQPVRDAFFRLSNLGFLAIRPQRATLITQIAETAVVDAVFTRTALEAECLKTVIESGNDAVLPTLKGCLAQQKAALDTADLEDFHALDEDFHAQICRLSGHSHVWLLIREQKAHMDRVRYLSLSSERRHFVFQQHTEIVDHVAAGEGAFRPLRPCVTTFAVF